MLFSADVVHTHQKRKPMVCNGEVNISEFVVWNNNHFESPDQLIF